MPRARRALQRRPGWTALCRAAGVEQAGPDPTKPTSANALAPAASSRRRPRAPAGTLHRVAADPAALARELSPTEQGRVQMLAYQLFSHREALMDARLPSPAWPTTPPCAASSLSSSTAWMNALTSTPACPRCPGCLAADPARRLPDPRDPHRSRPADATAPRPVPGRRPGATRAQNRTPLFVTLDKREGSASESPYYDYAISPELFHWQSQNAAGPDTKAGRRYCESPGTAGSSSSSCARRADCRIVRWDR